MINEFREMPRPPFPYTQTVAAKPSRVQNSVAPHADEEKWNWRGVAEVTHRATTKHSTKRV